MALTLPLAQGGHAAPVMHPKAGSSEVVSFTGTSAASAAIPNGIEVVRVIATQNCFVRLGAVATSSDMRLTAAVPEYFHVKEGETVNAIQESVAGDLNVQHMD